MLTGALLLYGHPVQRRGHAACRLRVAAIAARDLRAVYWPAVDMPNVGYLDSIRGLRERGANVEREGIVAALTDNAPGSVSHGPAAPGGSLALAWPGSNGSARSYGTGSAIGGARRRALAAPPDASRAGGATPATTRARATRGAPPPSAAGRGPAPIGGAPGLVRLAHGPRAGGSRRRLRASLAGYAGDALAIASAHLTRDRCVCPEGSCLVRPAERITRPPGGVDGIFPLFWVGERAAGETRALPS